MKFVKLALLALSVALASVSNLAGAIITTAVTITTPVYPVYVTLSGTALKNVQGTTAVDVGAGKLGLLIVDTAGDGFLTGFTGGTSPVSGNPLVSGNPSNPQAGIYGAPDQAAAALAINSTFGGDLVIARLTTAVSLGDTTIGVSLSNFNAEPYLNKNYAIVWFDTLTTAGAETTASSGTYFGIARGVDWTFTGGGPLTFSSYSFGTGVSNLDQVTLANGASGLAATAASGQSVAFATPGTSLQLDITPFTAAETALPLVNAGLVTLSPLAQFSVVTGAASHGGVNALKFTTVDNGTTYAERTVVGASVVSFWWRVSSEKDYDLFKYSVDGVQQQAISGDGVWAYQTFTLAAGTHQIRWTYTKDGADASFDDAGYLDDLVIVDAYKDLQVTLAGAVVTASGTLDFGTEQQSSADVARSLTLKNNGTIPLAVTATIPSNSGFAFSTGLLTRSLTINAGQQTALDMKMLTATGGQKTALLGIVATGSLTAPPAVTLSGFIQPTAPVIACSWSGGALTSGQSTAVDFGTAPSDVTFTVANTGTAVLSLSTVTVSPTANFQVTRQPASTVAINGSTTFTVRALDASRGNQSATVTVASDAYNTPSFTIPVTSRALLAVAGTGAVVGSLVNTGTTALWDTASTILADGSTGLAMKTGATPNSGNSTFGATFEGPGILSWNWKVSAQKDYDWLLCEVNGVEVAGISTKTAAWQSQVLQIPAGSQVRWIYRKDAANSSGTDSGHLADIRFSKYATAQSSFDTWSAARGGLTPTQVLPKGGMQAMFAWLGGVDPTTGPAVGTYQPSVSSGIYQFRYRVDKGAAGMTQPQVSTDLVNWDSRRMKQTLISEDSTSAVIELSVAATGKTFSRLAANVPVYTPPAPTGFVYVAAGTLPSSSELSGQSVAAFYIAKTETTWGQWQSVRTYAAANGYDIGSAGAGSGTDYPVTNVSWYQAAKSCNARSEQEGLTPVYRVNNQVYKTGDSAPTVDATANGYRLPTEAQWEFAARGGVSTQNYEYSGSNDVNAVAWYDLNSGGTTHAVGTKQANELGVFDMSGNVLEWCESWYPGYEGTYRVGRGGCWINGTNNCRVANRNSDPTPGLSFIGFRVARRSVQ